MTTSVSRSARKVAGIVIVTLAAGSLIQIGGSSLIARQGLRPASRTKSCPEGYRSLSQIEANEPSAPGSMFELGTGSARSDLLFEKEQLEDLAREFGGDAVANGLCISEKHPEGMKEMAANFAQRTAVSYAPVAGAKAGARASALGQRRGLAPNHPTLDNRWKRFGRGPLDSADRGFGGVNGLGNVYVMGRITDFDWDPAREHLYASVAYGGLWRSKDYGRSWRSVGESLPTQTVGSVGYSKVAGGRLMVLTGDGSFGASSLEGMGAFYSDNDGRTWKKSKGIPSNAFGFKVAVDQANPRIVYAATGSGLYRSQDGGRSFRNVVLPTGQCAGRSNRSPGCLFDNTVTDVVVQAPGGTTQVPASKQGSPVVAAVGWRGGNSENPDGTVQSPNNGIYFSDHGAIGTFQKVEDPGFAPQDHIGRIEFGAATGPDQDHNYLYATVQDAFYYALRNYPPSIGWPKQTPNELKNAQFPHIFNGVYVSSDFGRTWRLMASGDELNGPHTGSALAIAGQALAYIGPGVQTWYNLFIEPDPTRALEGIPTRVIFGMEEVWQNELTNTPQAAKSSFRVIGRYFSGETCMLLGWPGACPAQRENPPESMLTPTTTTHPDQHAAIFIPREDGKVTLVVGNDGGVYTQTVGPDGEFSNDKWGNGSNAGFNTLLPYHASRANDGTVWMGLQDNGTAKIVRRYREKAVPDDPATEENEGIPAGPLERQKQLMTKGGDGFFVAVDPKDSDVAYGEYVGGALAATKDGGETWSEMNPPITNAQFSTPFVMDPLDPEHLMIAGKEVVETGSGAGTSAMDWATLFDLGTRTRPGNPKASPTATDPANQMSAIAMRGPRAYVGYCGTCDVLNNPAPFKNGLATNVGGNLPPKRYSSDGWHIARAKGLPNRYITSIAMDPKDPKRVYVTLGGYSRRWTPPGMLDSARRIGEGHVFMSRDGGETFRNISSSLPDAPFTSVVLRGKQLVLGSDVGVFVSKPGTRCLRRGAPKRCRAYVALGRGLPEVPISTVEVARDDLNLLTVATWGRGVYQYRFGPKRRPRGGGGGATQPSVDAGPLKGEQVALFDFELGEHGFTSKTTNDNMFWRRGAPGHVSAASMHLVPYTDQSSAALISPEIPLAGDSTVEVSWWQLMNLEECCDSMTLYWSSDGFKWFKVKTFFDSVVQAASEGRPYDWTQQKVTFEAPGGKLFLRFVVTSDQLVSGPAYTDMLIDDITVRR